MGKCVASGLARVFTVLVAVAFFAGAAEANCRPDRVDLRGPTGLNSFRVAVADTMQSQSRGLMFVTEMEDDVGMLFIYDRTRKVSFWMFNTYIPLDMIFIDERGVVQKVHANARPHDTTAIPSGSRVRSVLEINGGLARKLGIVAGTEIRHPGLPQARAAWPCEGQ